MELVRVMFISSDTVLAGRDNIENYCGAEAVCRAERFAKEKDQLLSLGGAYLIRRFVGDMSELTYNSAGKPFSSKAFFNLSHSEELIGIAIASEPTGLDIEKCSDENNDLEQFCLSEDEMQLHLPFLACFTAKEALVKAQGDGLPDDLKSVPCIPLEGPVVYKDSLYYRKQLDINGYYASVCLKNIDFKLQEEWIDVV